MRSFQPQDISDDRPIEIVNIFCSETITIFGAVMLDGGNEVKSDGLWQRRCVLVSFVIIMRWFYHTRVLLLLCRRICLGSLYKRHAADGGMHARRRAVRQQMLLGGSTCFVRHFKGGMHSKLSVNNKQDVK
eukprot:scaffold495_cov152-Skeletonema_menzelii.AAC.1